MHSLKIIPLDRNNRASAPLTAPGIEVGEFRPLIRIHPQVEGCGAGITITDLDGNVLLTVRDTDWPVRGLEKEDNYQPEGEDYHPDCPFHAGDTVEFIGPSTTYEGKTGYLLHPPIGTQGKVFIPRIDGLRRASRGDRPYFVWVAWFGDRSRVSENLMLSDELRKVFGPPTPWAHGPSSFNQQEV